MRLPTAVQLKLTPYVDGGSEPILRTESPYLGDNDDDDDDDVTINYTTHIGGKVLRFGKKNLLKATCRSAPSSPKRGSCLFLSPKRDVQSNEELDEWDVAPLINCDS